MRPEINLEVARKVLATVDAGLVNGIGKPIPGQMCVEAAVCYALGLPHGDDPKCVGVAVRSFKIRLNDSNWSSSISRAKGLRRVAIAQLGSDSINQTIFTQELVLQTIKQILPIALRSVAKLIYSHRESLESAAAACENATAYAANVAARAAARAAAYAAHAANAADYAAHAAAYAATAAATAADYAANVADYAATAADYAARAAAYAANATAYADNVAAHAANAADYAAADNILSQTAEIAVQVLINLKSPGAKWLHLCN